MNGSPVPLVFGPVPSRRLGKSMGINNIPAKNCSYSCVYCQVGRTTRLRIDRQRYHDPNLIFSEVSDRLASARNSGERVDFLTFVPDGEPTLDAKLGREIALLKTLGVPIAVITNSTLLWRADVRKDLAAADTVSVKIDSVQEAIWRRMNRPHGSLHLSRILDGISTFAAEYQQTLITESMLVRNLNDSETQLRELAAFIGTLRPSRAYLSVPTRPPAESSVRCPSEAALVIAHQLLSATGTSAEVLSGYEGNDFVSIGAFESDLLGITSVHPMRRDAVESLLSRSNSSWNAIESLIHRGALVKTSYRGAEYYLRRFGSRRENQP